MDCIFYLFNLYKAVEIKQFSTMGTTDRINIEWAALHSLVIHSFRQQGF